MKKSKLFSYWKKITISSVMLMLSCVANAQVFPIQVTTQLLPPYSPFLNDYTSPESQNLIVNITSNDPMLLAYRCKLRITIEGLGITIRTKSTFVTQPIILSAGEIETRYGSDLVDYFHPDNLDFAGYSRNEYQNNARLPEGVYRISVEVLDYNRNTVVSNKGTAVAWMMLNDPPLLNFPMNEHKMTVIDPTNIVFNWTPRHTGSPNSAFTTDYVFRLIELWPVDRNPYDAFLTQTPLFELSTSQTQIVYTAAEPALLPGRRYAWQVQAVDQSGRGLFRNDGKSEVHVFQFGDLVGTPLNLRKETANETTIAVRWEPSTQGEMPDQYRLRYRPESSETWYESIATDRWYTITSLQPDTRYEVQIRAEKQDKFSDYSSGISMFTAGKGDSNFSCGSPATIVEPEESAPLFELTPGDYFTCGDFKIIVTEVTPISLGNFRGRGMMPVNLFNGASVIVTFAGAINDKLQMTSGNVETVYNRGSEIGQVVDEMYNIGEKKEEPTSTTEDSELDDVINFDGVIDSVYLSNDSVIVVVDENGTTTNFDRPMDGEGAAEEVVIEDAEGNSVVVGKDGEVKDGPSKATPDALADAANIDYEVVFNQHNQQQFGFDSKDDFGMYDEVKIRENEEYAVPWKSVKVGAQDLILAEVQKHNFPEEVGFKNSFGNVPSMASQTGKEIHVQGLVSEQTEQVSAYVRIKKDSSDKDATELEVGRVNVVAYDEIINQLYIVPVNGASVPAGLQTELNEIYSQAVVKWEVMIQPNFQVEAEYLTNMDSENSSWLSAFPDKMKVLNRMYRQEHDVDKDAYYIFIIPGPASARKGFMPFKRRFGYVFADNNSDDEIAKTIAHELGHGAFRLRHTFSQEQFMAQQGRTNNLMDYGEGVHLKKYQWDAVRHPEAMVAWLEDEEEGAYSWSGTLVDEQHTELFDHIYDNNHVGTQMEGSRLIYLTKIERLLNEEPEQEAFDLDYDGDDEHKAWIKEWKIRVVNSETVLNNTIKVIQDTKQGEKLGAIYLRPKHIYIAKYKYNDIDYPIAIYNAGTAEVMDKVFTKVEITDINQLDDEENRKRVYIEETFFSYFIIAFYEEGKTTPTIMLQLEKFPFSDYKNNSMEEWLKFLRILKEPEKEDQEEETCSSAFCCTKCGRDLKMTEERFAEIFPSIIENKDEFVSAFNVCLQEVAFEYNTCDRQAKIFAQIAIETNNLKSRTEAKGKTWKLTGNNQLLDYFKATLKAKQRWFNQDFWDTKLYKNFCQVGYYESIETDEIIPVEERYNASVTTDCYGYYNGNIQSQYLVKIPTEFIPDSLGEYKIYTEPTSTQKLQIEKNIFNYAYGGALGNGDHLTTDDGFNFRGRGAIQVTGRANYEALHSKLQAPPYNVTDVNILTNPDAVANMPKLVLYSAFVHFKGQLRNDITNLDKLSIEQVSALVNTGNENGTANHSEQRTAKYNSLLESQFKCDE